MCTSSKFYPVKNYKLNYRQEFGDNKVLHFTDKDMKHAIISDKMAVMGNTSRAVMGNTSSVAFVRLKGGESLG